MSKTYSKISALSKGLAVLNIIGSSPTPVTARDIAEQAGITYSTAMNNIITLEDAGFIEKQGSGYIGSFKLASIWTNRMSYLKRKKTIISDEIEVLEKAVRND
ncbi:MAG: helix-turn-helix domain-containing protein [Mucispirillum sp.]|nr:helix-turn-helix domain-containing protein [Mucispirillum sp.]